MHILQRFTSLPPNVNNVDIKPDHVNDIEPTADKRHAVHMSSRFKPVKFVTFPASFVWLKAPTVPIA